MPVSTPHLPHGLDLVVDFVNTVDLETRVEELTGAEQLGTWLAKRGLLSPEAPVSVAEHRAGLELREALREVLGAHTHGASAVSAQAVLERVAEAGRLSVAFPGADGVAIVARAPGVAGALAGLLVPVAEAGADGSWQRVKACDDDACRAAFYDRSRNRSGRWCNMAICGNRSKVRAYRSKRDRGDGAA